MRQQVQCWLRIMTPRCELCAHRSDLQPDERRNLTKAARQPLSQPLSGVQSGPAEMQLPCRVSPTCGPFENGANQATCSGSPWLRACTAEKVSVLLKLTLGPKVPNERKPGATIWLCSDSRLCLYFQPARCTEVRGKGADPCRTLPELIQQGRHGGTARTDTGTLVETLWALSEL